MLTLFGVNGVTTQEHSSESGSWHGKFSASVHALDDVANRKLYNVS